MVNRPKRHESIGGILEPRGPAARRASKKPGQTPYGTPIGGSGGPAARRASKDQFSQPQLPVIYQGQQNPNTVYIVPESYRQKRPGPVSRIMDSRLAAFGAVGAAAFGVGTLVLNFSFNWFNTHEQGTLNVLPPSASVERYSAFVTGTAESDFSIDGSTDCGGVGGIDVHTEWHALATVANKIGNFTINVSADQSQVDITLDRYPELESGLQLEKTMIDSAEDSWATACNGDDLTRVVTSSMLVSQATADTIGACIVKRPDFQSDLRDQLAQIGLEAYPDASVVNVNIPVDDQRDESVSALEALRQELRGNGVSIASGPVDNCEFRNFEMIPIVLDLEDQAAGGQDG